MRTPSSRACGSREVNSPIPGWGALEICGELAPPVPYRKAGCLHSRKASCRQRAARHTGAHLPQKQKGQADRLSFLIIMPWAGSPGRPGRPRAVPPPLPGRRHRPSASPQAAPGLRGAATAHPPSATPHGRRYAGQCRWTQLLPGSPSRAGSLRPRGRRAVPRAQNSRAGHSPHRGAPPGRQTIAPSSMSAWVKSPAAPSG